MYLITMADLGEAQGVIEKFNLKKNGDSFFIGENLNLLLTGEGPFEAAIQTSYELGKNSYQEVINLGIAGALKDELKLGEIYPIRTHYLIQDFKPQFKSFQGVHEGRDCLTSFERILDPEKSKKLVGLGHIVDREAWGVAFASKSAGVKFSSYKLISDFAGTLGACEVIRDKASEFSEKLASSLEGLLLEKVSLETSSEFSIPGLHFTFSTIQRFKNLIKKISIRNNCTEDEVIQNLPIEGIDPALRPKEKTRVLLERLENSLDPLRMSLMAEKEKWLDELKGSGIEIEVDPQWEDYNIKVKFDVKSDEELIHKLNKLQSFSLTPWQNIMEGKIHVE